MKLGDHTVFSRKMSGNSSPICLTFGSCDHCPAGFIHCSNQYNLSESICAFANMAKRWEKYKLHKGFDNHYDKNNLQRKAAWILTSAPWDTPSSMDTFFLRGIILGKNNLSVTIVVRLSDLLNSNIAPWWVYPSG